MESAAARIGTSYPKHSEALAVPTDEVLGVTTVNALRQLNQRLSNMRVTCAGCEVRRGLIFRSW